MNKFDGGQNVSHLNSSGKQSQGPGSLNNSSIILNESIKSAAGSNPNNIFIGSSKPNTSAYMTHKKVSPNMYAGGPQPSTVYQQNHVLTGPPTANQFEVLGVSTQKQKSQSPNRFTDGRTTATGGQRKNNSGQVSFLNNAAKKTMANGFNTNKSSGVGGSGGPSAANPNATYHGVKNKLWTGFYPKYQP